MGTVPTPFHFTALTVPTAANMNAGIEDALAFLLTPPQAHVYHSADRTLTTATWTLAIFDSETADTDAMHSTSSNTSRLVCKTAGTYLVAAQVYFAPNATGGRGVNITKNGAGTRSSTSPIVSDGFSAGVNNTNQLVSVTALVSLAVNDYVELFVYQSSGGNLNYIGGTQGTKFSARWVSA